MKYPIVSHVETGHDGDDSPLSDLLDALVNDRGRVVAAKALGVNYRTLVNCEQSRRVSRRMRQTSEEFRDALGIADDEPGDVDGDDPEDIRSEALDQRVAALEEQPDEEHAFGPAAPLVAEWRQLLTGGDQATSRVDRARAVVRRWELEAVMLKDFYLTLPPETHPLDDARQADHVRWRQETLAEARRNLGQAQRAQLIKRILTLGLWER